MHYLFRNYHDLLGWRDAQPAFVVEHYCTTDGFQILLAFFNDQ